MMMMIIIKYIKLNKKIFYKIDVQTNNDNLIYIFFIIIINIFFFFKIN